MSDTISAGAHSGITPIRSRRETGAGLADELIHLPLVARYAASLFMVGLTAGVAVAVERLAAPSNLALFFVAPVVLAAAAFGWGPSLAAVVSGVLAFDFFFTEPKYSLEIASLSDIWAAGLLFIIAAIVSGVAAVARRGGEEARDEAMRAEALRALAHSVVEGRLDEEIIQASAATLSLIFQAPSVVFAERCGVFKPLALSGGARITAAEEAAAREASQLRLPARAETYPFPHSSFDLWPVTSRAGRRYVLGVDFKHAAARRPATPERFVEMVMACLAAAG